MTGRTRSIRAYLAALVVGAILPFIAAHALVAYRHAVEERQKAKQVVTSFAHVAAADAMHFLYDARVTLERLAAQSALRSLNAVQCDTYLRFFTCANPNFCAISVVAPPGRLICSQAQERTVPVDVLADRQWFDAVMAHNAFTVSRPFVDPNSRRPVEAIGYPIQGERGAPKGAIAIAVDLLDYDSIHYRTGLEGARLPAGSVVTIVDSQGTVVARWPEAGRWIGRHEANADIVRHVLSKASGTTWARGVDGQEKFYSFLPLPAANEHLYVGFPAAFFAPSPLRLAVRDSAAGLLLAAIAAWLAARSLGAWISRPVQALAAATREAALGNLTVRISAAGPGEIREVSARFNEMVAARAEAEAALAEEKNLIQVTLESIGDAVLTTDPGGRITYLNPGAEQLTGWRAPQARGQPLYEVVHLLDAVTREPLRKALQDALRDGALVSIADPTLLVRRDGTETAVADSAAPINDIQGRFLGMVIVFRDVSKSRELTKRLSWQATHDALTTLVNRSEFENRTRALLADVKRSGREGALLYLDLDQFKVINDTCGHAAGDALLKQLAGLLHGGVREGDTLARLGGDEFGVLVENCPLGQALRIADALREAVQDFRFSWQGKLFAVGVSIGIVGIGSSTESIGTLLSAADAACYAAKERGRNRIHLFEPNDLELFRRLGEMHWAQRLSTAFEDERFRLYGQPIVPLAETADAPGAYSEVLLRLLDEEGALVLPDVFLPAAERYGLMPTLDRWVIRTLFGWIARARDRATIYYVNLSGHAVSDEHFLDFVIDQFTQTGLDPQTIRFEITETTAVSNLLHAGRFITVLKNMGCQFALDDFGSGVSSFAYLKMLDVDYVKIAGNFVRDIDTDPVNRAMVQAINHIGHLMNLKTIAESVENDAVLAELRRMGVDYVQGFRLAEPKALEDT
ncbi:MAG: EAL domain-containing protein [Betaproteobacteria bacterium]|nr:EAL domain-containing protein [Betaproteobacteria bacterium]